MQGVVEARPVRSPWRLVAALLVLTFALFAGTVFTTQDRAHAVLPLVGVAAAALPFSVVSAGVGGTISTVGTGAALAGGAITAAAAFAANFAVRSFFEWGDDAPDDLGDAPTTAPPDYTYGWTQPAGKTGASSGTFTCIGSTQCNWTVSATANGVIAVSGSVSDGVTGSWADWTGTNCPSGTGSTGYRLVLAPSNGYAASASGMRPGCTGGTFVFKYPQNNSYIMGRANYTGTGVASTAPPASDPGKTPLDITPRTSCRHGDGSVTNVVGGKVATVRSDTAHLSLDYPACPTGSVVESRSAPITRTSDGAVLGDALTGEVGSSPTPWSPPAVPAEYPDCQNRTCVMTLTATAPDGSVVTCSVAGQCVGYAAVVQQYPGTGTGAATGPRTGPDGRSYHCRFGSYSVAVAECQVIPGAGLPAAGTGTATEPTSDDCGFTLNPLTAVKCGLSWAFVPSPGVLQSAHATASAGFTATGLPAWGTAVAGVGTGLAGVGANAAGCAGPAFTIPLRGESYSFQPLNACSQPMQGVAVVIKVLISLAVCVAGAKLCARPLLASFGMDRAV